MLKRTPGRIPRLKSSVVKLVTRLDARLSRPVKSTKVMEKNSTTLGPIVVEAWIMYGLLLSAVMLTGLDNQRDHEQ